LLVLSLLTVLSAAAGGYLYYSVVTEAALKEAERQAAVRLEMLSKSIASFLLENTKIVRALAGMDEFRTLLEHPSPSAADSAHAILDPFAESLEVDACYLMDQQGLTIASSNRNAPDSFMNQNFSFRPYFKKAIHGWPTSYLALGTTSGRRGVYNSHPVYGKNREDPIGVMVIKSPIDVIENRLGLTSDDIILMTDPRGVIFISNRGQWLFQLAWKASEADLNAIASERQFGEGPWAWIGLERGKNQDEVFLSGNRYLLHQVEIDPFPGWKVLHLRSFEAIAKSISDPFFRITGPVVLLLCALVGATVFVLYRKASDELVQRRAAEKALRESESRYRSLYHNTPAMLHSIDQDGSLVSISDYWLEAMGYDRSDVVGRPLTDFMSEASQKYAREEVFPEFFRKGFCNEIPYQLIKKNGEMIDVLLSSIAVRDEKENIVRSLAVSIDVTERKRAEEALRRAKEALSRYSEELERQVRERTREISGILKYTPDVVYIKDRQGRYRLINARYEEMLGLQKEQVQGKTDEALFPADIAAQFRANDQKVLVEKRSIQVEEIFPQAKGTRIFLSVKFPFYDGSGKIVGVCGISTDITAVKKAQNQLRRLSGSMIVSQEKERTAIARELHDELGQVLTALQMDAVWLADRLKTESPEAAERALTMRRLIDNTIDEVRSIAIRLRPGVLDTLGLEDALEWAASDFERRTEISCTFQRDSVPAVTDTLATAAYRIAQEALTNVGRHAGASRIDMRLRAEDGHLALTVEDNGKGFDTAVLSDSEALGVAGMRERAGLVGGTLRVDSNIGAGTRVELRVPLSGHLR
jgi:PAS domain S-box-containing protein